MNDADLWQLLAGVEDPELPISIVDLGLVRSIRVADQAVEVALTFTSMGCPCREWILEEVVAQVSRGLPGKEVRIQVVWDQPWTVAHLTPKGRTVLEQMGITLS
jgi:metal-sulfur cluster biosynthetic enzyme